MTARHAFFAAPFYADRCDARVEDDGQRRQCCAKPNDPIHLGAVAVTPPQEAPSTDQTGSAPPRFYFWRNEREPNTWFVTTFTKEKIAEMEAENADLRERLEGTEASAEDEGDAHAETLRLLKLREKERDDARAELAVTIEPDAYRRLHEQASRGRAAADEIAALKIHVAKLQRRLTREPPVAYREPTWTGAVLDALDLLTRDRIPDLARYTDRMPPRMGMLIRTIRERTLAILDSADEALAALAAAQKRIEALEGALKNADTAIRWAIKDDYDFGGSLRSPTLMALNDFCVKNKQQPAALASPSESAPQHDCDENRCETFPNWPSREGAYLGTKPTAESAPQPTPETRVDLEALGKLLAGATAGPWDVFCGLCPDGKRGTFIVGRGDGGWGTRIAKIHRDSSDTDEDAIVALRNAAPSLIAELRARRAAPTSVPAHPAAPAPVEAGREDRCSACGSQRILQDDGTLGACGFLECKDPMADYRLENPSSGAV